MTKKVSWLIWTLALIVVNLGILPIVMFSLFATAEGTSIFSVDYLIALTILILGNLVIFHLALTISHQNKKGFIIGLFITVFQSLGLVLLINTIQVLGIVLIGVSIVAALVMIIIELRRKK